MEEDQVMAEAEGVTEAAVVQDMAVREAVLVAAAAEVMVAMMEVNNFYKVFCACRLFRFTTNYHATKD